MATPRREGGGGTGDELALHTELASEAVLDLGGGPQSVRSLEERHTFDAAPSQAAPREVLALASGVGSVRDMDEVPPPRGADGARRRPGNEDGCGRGRGGEGSASPKAAVPKDGGGRRSSRRRSHS